MTYKCTKSWHLVHQSILTDNSSTGANEVVYEYPEMSPKSNDPKMENCAAYGVINIGRL